MIFIIRAFQSRTVLIEGTVGYLQMSRIIDEIKHLKLRGPDELIVLHLKDARISFGPALILIRVMKKYESTTDFFTQAQGECYDSAPLILMAGKVGFRSAHFTTRIQVSCDLNSLSNKYMYIELTQTRIRDLIQPGEIHESCTLLFDTKLKQNRCESLVQQLVNQPKDMFLKSKRIYQEFSVKRLFIQQVTEHTNVPEKEVALTWLTGKKIDLLESLEISLLDSIHRDMG